MRRARSFPWCLHPEAETCRPLGATPESLLAYARGGDHASASVPLQEPTRVGVLVVDDQTPFRRVALEVVEATPGFEPLGEAASGEEALALVAQLSPELILLDVRMPVMDGIETARRLSAVHPGGVVVLISIDDPVRVARCCGVLRCQGADPETRFRIRRPAPALGCAWGHRLSRFSSRPALVLFMR